ncbi:hypothetical protein BMS3Abin04_01806 [bacterium BMS3Abin04]|nr:hypothetical protein BMS3Abin04_01806 [bacterium BMS3Abin04]
MNKTIITLLFTIFLISTVIFAHGNHKMKKEMHKPDTLTIVAGDTIAINGIATKEFLANKVVEKEKEDEESQEIKEITFDSLFQHIHNKVIHFPIALSIVGILLMILGFKDDKYWSALKILIPFAALMSIVAVLAGLSQAEPFEGTSTYGLVEIHKLLGFGVLASLILWSITLYVEKFKKFVWLFAILTVILISIAGFYGGVIAH